jgi:hypothetical protein
MLNGVDRFRELACALQGAEERAHMGNPDFRVGGRIFATLSGQAQGRGVLKLTVEQQAEFVAELPGVFEPVQGGWGRMGMTYILLDASDKETMRGALMTAYKNVVDRKAGAARVKSAMQTKRRKKPQD